MDIHQLIDTVNQLNGKLGDLDKTEVAKKQMLEDTNREIAKSTQLLENKARELGKLIDNKLKGLKNLDDELSNSQALLAKINNSNQSDSTDEVSNGRSADNNGAAANSENGEEISLPERQSRANLMNSSLEDFIAQKKFQEEYKVKYPESTKFRLTDKDFEVVLGIIRDKAKQSGNPSEPIDEYLSSYAHTLTDSQANILEQVKNKALLN